MAIRIFDDGHATRAVMFDSVTEIAFGPVSNECDYEGCTMDAIQILEHFIEWTRDNYVTYDHTRDFRSWTPHEVMAAWMAFNRDQHSHTS